MHTELMKLSSMVVDMHARLSPTIQAKWNTDVAILAKAHNNKYAELLTNNERLEKLLQLLENIEHFEQRPALNQNTMKIEKVVDSGESTGI